MSLVINTNLASINGQVNLASSQASLSTAMQRLSSGLRINSAKDDAAGLAIADRMTSQVNGMTVAVRNANDGISLTQTADGALGSLTTTLQTMRDLAVQASSTASMSASDRAKLNTEFTALNSELTRIVSNTQFNGKNILAGDLAGGVNVQVGATTDTNSQISVAVSNMHTLLNPVSSASLDPTSLAVDSTLAATVNNFAAASGKDANISFANSAATLANAAVVAAQAAAASPTDLALAAAAAKANLLAANAIQASSSNTAANAGTLKTDGLVSTAFSNSASAASANNTSAATAIAATNSLINGGTDSTGATVTAAASTNAAQAASLLTTAQQLATAAAADVGAAGQNVYAATMYSLTGDTLSQLQTAKATTGNVNLLASNLPTSISLATVQATGTDANGNTTYGAGTTPVTYAAPAVPAGGASGGNVVNDAVNRAIQSGDAFNSDRQAQITLAGLQIAKAIASASYVNDPNATSTANQTSMTSFVNSNSLVTNLSSQADAVGTAYSLSAINKIDDAVAAVDNERSNLGSAQNRFTNTISNLQSGIQNQSAAKSRITDADYATETANLSRAQILQQAGTAMLAQANQSGQSVMTLLR